MGFEIVDRELQHGSQLLEFKRVAAEFWGVVRRFVVIAEQMVIVGAAGGGCRQKMLRQNYACAQPRTVGTVAALSDAIEPVAGSNDPSIRGRALQVLAEILENRGVFGGEGRKVVDCLVDARCQTGSGHVVAEDSTIRHLGEEGRLRNEIADEVRDVFLPFRSERFLISRPAAERDYDCFSLAGSDAGSSGQAGREQGTAQGDACRAA